MKQNVSIAVIGSKATKFCEKAGKKGGETDYRLWHSSFSGKTLTFCEPHKWPEKLSALAYCLNLSQHAVIAEDEAGAAFGEALVAIDVLEKKSGCFATEFGLEQYAKGTSAESFEAKPLEEALQWAREQSSKPVQGEAKVVVDSSFNVKGVGQVLLGFVERGTVRVHDDLTAYPSGAKITVRSIQVQDEDVKEAPCYSRVGLCFKGASVDEISRGQVLSTSPVPTPAKLDLSVKKSRFARELPEHCHAFIGLQNAACKVEWGETAAVTFEEPVAFDSEKVLLCDLNRALPRVIAAGKTIK